MHKKLPTALMVWTSLYAISMVVLYLTITLNWAAYELLQGIMQTVFGVDKPWTGFMVEIRDAWPPKFRPETSGIASILLILQVTLVLANDTSGKMGRNLKTVSAVAAFLVLSVVAAIVLWSSLETMEMFASGTLYPSVFTGLGSLGLSCLACFIGLSLWQGYRPRISVVTVFHKYLIAASLVLLPISSAIDMAAKSESRRSTHVEMLFIILLLLVSSWLALRVCLSLSATRRVLLLLRNPKGEPL